MRLLADRAATPSASGRDAALPRIPSPRVARRARSAPRLPRASRHRRCQRADTARFARAALWRHRPHAGRRTPRRRQIERHAPAATCVPAASDGNVRSISLTIVSATASASRPSSPLTVTGALPSHRVEKALELEAERLTIRRDERYALDERLDRLRTLRQLGEIDVSPQPEELSFAGGEIERQIAALLKDAHFAHSLARHAARRNVRDRAVVESQTARSRCRRTASAPARRRPTRPGCGCRPVCARDRCRES